MRERVLVSFLRRDIWLARSLTVKGPFGATRDVGCFTYLSQRSGDGLSPNSVGSCPSPKIRRRAKSVGQSSPVHSCTFTAPGTRTRMTSAESCRQLMQAARGFELTPKRLRHAIRRRSDQPFLAGRVPSCEVVFVRRRPCMFGRRGYGVSEQTSVNSGEMLALLSSPGVLGQGSPRAAGAVLSVANPASVWAGHGFSEQASRPWGTRLAVGHVALVDAPVGFSGAGVVSWPRASFWAGRS